MDNRIKTASVEIVIETTYGADYRATVTIADYEPLSAFCERVSNATKSLVEEAGGQFQDPGHDQ